MKLLWFLTIALLAFSVETRADDCQQKVKLAAIARAEQVLQPVSRLNYMGTSMYGQNYYRVTLSDIGREVDVDVTVEKHCRITSISVSEQPDGN